MAAESKIAIYAALAGNTALALKKLGVASDSHLADHTASRGRHPIGPAV